MIRTHEIGRQGVPDGITRVPVVVTSSGERHTGLEVLRWLESLVPVEFEGCPFGAGCRLMTNFDEPPDEVGDAFPIDAYGIELAPPMTRELQERINKPLTEAYNDIKKKTR